MRTESKSWTPRDAARLAADRDWIERCVAVRRRERMEARALTTHCASLHAMIATATRDGGLFDADRGRPHLRRDLVGEGREVLREQTH